MNKHTYVFREMFAFDKASNLSSADTDNTLGHQRSLQSLRRLKSGTFFTSYVSGINLNTAWLKLRIYTYGNIS